MRRKLTFTQEIHPDVPPPLFMSELAEHQGLVWQVYVDGAPFIGVPIGGDVNGAAEEAFGHRDRILATGRYEYVDVRIRPERRSGEAERRHDQLVGNAGDARTHDRRTAA